MPQTTLGEVSVVISWLLVLASSVGFVLPPGALPAGAPVVYAAYVQDFTGVVTISVIVPACACAGQTLTLGRSSASGGPYAPVGTSRALGSGPGGSAADNESTWTDSPGPGTWFYSASLGSAQSPEVSLVVPALWWPAAAALSAVFQ